MKKIMFNDKHYLTDSVTHGHKRMTRRIIPHQPEGNDWEIRFYNFSDPRYEDDPMKDPYFGSIAWQAPDGRNTGLNKLQWLPGEVVAIAQPYMNIPVFAADPEYADMTDFAAGWSNKMFVRAEYMPYHIKITNVKLERLQDISDEDCIKEGIDKLREPVGVLERNFLNGYIEEDQYKRFVKDGEVFISYQFNEDPVNCKIIRHPTPQDAFAALINKTCGKGTWEKNPWVFVYEFELVK